MKTPEISYVAVLRVAHPDSPSLREIGRQIGLSAAAVSAFELGRVTLGPDKIAEYAKAVGRSVEEVRARWTRQALAFHSAKALELRAELARMSGRKPRRGARTSRLAKAK